MDNNEKISSLLETRKKLKERLEKLNRSFEQEKENEEAWPGHDSTFLLQIQQEEQLIHSLLADTEKQFKELGYEIKDN
jgi:arginine decarboxylase-like protein